MGYYSISGALQIDLCCLLKPSSKCILQSAQLTLLPRLIGYILVSLWCDKAPIPQQILKLMTAGVQIPCVAELLSAVADNFIWDSKSCKYFLQVVDDTSDSVLAKHFYLKIL